MSKILANQIANYGDDAPIEIKEGLNIPAGKPIQAAGSAGSSGQVLSTTGIDLAWITPFDGDYNSLSNRPSIPAAQINADWNASSGLGVILNKPAIPLQTSLVVNPAGTPALAYNGANGQFTYTPPDLSNYDTAYGWGDHSTEGYLTSLGDAAGVTTAKISNWDTAYGWGNHASAGYLTSYSETQTLDSVLALGASTTRDITTTGKILFSNNYANLGDLPNASTYHGMFAHVHNEGHGYFAHSNAWTQLLDTSSAIDELGNVDLSVAPTDGYVLKWEASSSSWKAFPDLVGTNNAGITLADLTVQTASAGTPSLSYSNTTGVFTYTPPDLSGFLTSFSETDPVFSASDAAGITASNIGNWDSAYGWGDHSTEGYLTSVPAQSFASLTGKPTTISGYGITDSYSNSDVDTHLNQSNPTSGHVLSWNGSDYAWVAQSGGGGGGASVTISDTAPAASAGDLWWESDTGRLKIYYQDTDSSQWVDTSPPLANPNGLSQTTTNGTNGITITSNTSGANANAIEFKTDNGTTSANRWRFVPNGHLLPTSNADYDIGSAEYKVRHLFLSDNTLYYEGSFLKVAQHDAGGAAQPASYLITLSKLKDALNASGDYESFKTAILAITDA